MTFKTGTQVKIIGINRNYINVWVIPSLHDIGQTEGLCQMLDGKIEAKLTGRDGAQTPCPAAALRYKMNPGLETFGKSWRQVPHAIKLSLWRVISFSLFGHNKVNFIC